MEQTPPIQNNNNAVINNDNSFGDETLISGPAFSAGRRKIREVLEQENDGKYDERNKENEDSTYKRSLLVNKSGGEGGCAGSIIKKGLQDVTNTAKRRRKSAHKEAVEATASPSLCTKSLEGKENDEVRSTQILRTFNTRCWRGS